MASEGSASGSGSTPGVIGSLRTLAASLVGIVQTRLELLANDLEEERVRTLQLVVLAAVAFFCAAVGLLLVTAWVVVAFWDQYRLATLAALALLYFGVAAVALWLLRTKAAQRTKLFSASLAELRRDSDLLKSR